MAFLECGNDRHAFVDSVTVNAYRSMLVCEHLGALSRAGYGWDGLQCGRQAERAITQVGRCGKEGFCACDSPAWSCGHAPGFAMESLQCSFRVLRDTTLRCMTRGESRYPTRCIPRTCSCCCRAEKRPLPAICHRLRHRLRFSSRRLWHQSQSGGATVPCR